jgi:hypothetical protein
VRGGSSEKREEIRAFADVQAVPAVPFRSHLWHTSLRLFCFPFSGSPDNPSPFTPHLPTPLLPHAPSLPPSHRQAPRPLVSRDEVRAGGAAAAAVEVTEAVAAEAAPSAVLAPVRPKSR